MQAARLRATLGEISSALEKVLRDRDRIFGGEFGKDVKAMGIQEVLSAPRSP